MANIVTSIVTELLPEILPGWWSDRDAGATVDAEAGDLQATAVPAQPADQHHSRAET